MFIVILASMLAAEPSIAKSDGSFAAEQLRNVAPRDIQDVAIETITGASPTVSSPRIEVAERGRPADPQSAIVERITGTVLRSPRATETNATDIDLQAAIIGSITGRR